MAKILLGSVSAIALTLSAAHAQTLVIDGQTGAVVTGRRTSTSGPCVHIKNSPNTTVSAADIGPCGTDNTTADSQGVLIENSPGTKVIDSYIHVERKAAGCCDSHTNVLIRNSDDALVQGNVIAYGESNVTIASGNGRSRRAKIIGNYLVNPRGPAPRGQNVHVYGENATLLNDDVVVSDNYAVTDQKINPALSASQEDSLSFGYNSNVTVARNYVLGGTSNSGAAITFDQGMVSGQIVDNLTPQYNAGIQWTSGAGSIARNKSLITAGGPNGAAIIIGTLGYATSPCSGITVDGNIAAATGANGGLYTDPGCTNVTYTSNTIDPSWGACSPGYGGAAPPASCAAYWQLAPFATKFPPPTIPPLPYACVAASPLSTNTSKPTCGAAPPVTMACTFAVPNTAITVTKGGPAVPVPPMSVICK